MTPEDLTAIEQRANAATDGPWRLGFDRGRNAYIETHGGTVVAAMSLERPIPDAVFLSSARSDIPALLAEVRRLQRQVAGLIDQEVGQAMDCAAHEREARADERAKFSAMSRYSTEAVDALLLAIETECRSYETQNDKLDALADAVRASLEPKP